MEFLLAKLDEFCADMNASAQQPGLLLRVLGLMALEMTALFAIPAFLYLGLGLEGVTFGELLLTQCLVMVLSRVVAIPGNAGGAEGAFTSSWPPLFGGDSGGGGGALALCGLFGGSAPGRALVGCAVSAQGGGRPRRTA